MKKIIIGFGEYETNVIKVDEQMIREIANKMKQLKNFEFSLGKNLIEDDEKIKLLLPDNFRDYDIIAKKIFEVDHIVNPIINIVSYKGPDTYEENSKCLNKSEIKYSTYEEKEILSILRTTKLREGKNIIKIAVVMESPHREEFVIENNKFKPLGPAMGASGNNIEKYLINLIKAIEKCYFVCNKYDIYIINPVKFQASLGSFYKKGLNDKIRNELWKCLYENVYKKEFLEELKKYDIIVNSCTAINKEYGKYQITNDLKSIENRTFDIIECSRHPGYWHLTTKLKFIDIAGKEIYLHDLNELNN
ncbi:hypothetical protein UT300007_12850 [Clostridium sp. CTA-7]